VLGLPQQLEYDAGSLSTQVSRLLKYNEVHLDAQIAQLATVHMGKNLSSAESSSLMCQC